MGSTENITESKWATEPIAVIGLSCKFAGDAKNAEGLWKLLAEGRNAWSEIPSSRFNARGAYNPNSEKLSTVRDHHVDLNMKRWLIVDAFFR